MSERLPNYLRTFRKRAYLTQDEVSFLLGTASGTRVSRYEQFRREPTLDTALAYGIIFAAPAEQLFAGLHDRIEEAVRDRAGQLVRRLEKEELGPAARHKLGVLRGILARSH
jgi:transcriptional regulator with XRE-family HTH domain